MGDSWENTDDQSLNVDAKKAAALNAGANEWKPSVAAKEWTPSWLPKQDQAAEAPQPAPAAAAAPTPAPAVEEQPPAPKEVAPAPKAAEEKPADTEAPKAAPAAAAKKPAPATEKMSATEIAAAEGAAAHSDLVDDPAGFEKELKEQLEAIKSADAREHLNIVFIGHVDAGKSTLSGSLLYALGAVDDRTIQKFEQEAKERNRESWFLAYIMDTNEEERAKGKTVEVGRAYFETEKKRFTILDAPGHKNYVPAMISGASQADVGVLVISCRKGEFESGFEGGTGQTGQTREHALLAKTLGIQKLVVVMNKMDEPTVQWSKERYDQCLKKLRPFLKGSGYRVKRDVTFLPISALKGINIKKPITKDVCPWAVELNDNKSLLDILDTTTISGRDETKPLRMTVVDRYTDRGVVLLSKVEQGACFVGQTVLVCPNQIKAKVEQIQINEVDVQGAKPGENITVRLSGINENEVSKGHVVSSRYFPIGGSTEIIGQVFLVGLLEHRPLFSAGYNAIFHAHTAEEECTVYNIAAILDQSGKIAKSSPPYAKSGQTIICKIRLEKSICLESYEKMMQLGRFTLRDEGKTIAIGIVKKCR